MDSSCCEQHGQDKVSAGPSVATPYIASRTNCTSMCFTAETSVTLTCAHVHVHLQPSSSLSDAYKQPVPHTNHETAREKCNTNVALKQLVDARKQSVHDTSCDSLSCAIHGCEQVITEASNNADGGMQAGVQDATG